MSSNISIDQQLNSKSTLYTEIVPSSNKPRTFVSKCVKKFSNYPLQKPEDDYPFRFEIETSFALITILFVLFAYFLYECNPYNIANYDYEGEDFIEPCNASITVDGLIRLKNTTENLHKILKDMFQELSSLNTALYFHLQHNITFDPNNDDLVIREQHIRHRYLHQAKKLDQQYTIYFHCYISNVKNYYKSVFFQNGFFTVVYLTIVGLFIFAAYYYIQQIDKNRLTEYQLLMHERNNFLINFAIILNAFCGIGALMMFFFPVFDEHYIKEFPL